MRQNLQKRRKDEKRKKKKAVLLVSTKKPRTLSTRKLGISKIIN